MKKLLRGLIGEARDLLDGEGKLTRNGKVFEGEFEMGKFLGKLD